MTTDTLIKPRACVVCGLRATVLVCKECAERDDIVETVEGWLRKNADHAALVRKAFIDMQFDHWDDWRALKAARSTNDWTAERAARNRAAGNIYGKLLDAEQAMTDALEPLEIERTRLSWALEAVRGL